MQNCTACQPGPNMGFCFFERCCKLTLRSLASFSYTFVLFFSLPKPLKTMRDTREQVSSLTGDWGWPDGAARSRPPPAYPISCLAISFPFLAKTSSGCAAINGASFRPSVLNFSFRPGEGFWFGLFLFHVTAVYRCAQLLSAPDDIAFSVRVNFAFLLQAQ